MNTEQALNILSNLASICVKKGGVFENLNEVSSVNMALHTLRESLLVKTDETEDEK